jgi:hypothetical protein
MVEKPGLRAASGGKTDALAWVESELVESELVESELVDGVREMFDRYSASDSVLVLAKTVPIPSLGDLLAASRRSCGVTGRGLRAGSVRDAQLLVSRAPTISYGDLTVLI